MSAAISIPVAAIAHVHQKKTRPARTWVAPPFRASAGVQNAARPMSPAIT